MIELWEKAWSQSEKEAPFIDLFDMMYVYGACVMGVLFGAALVVLYGGMR